MKKSATMRDVAKLAGVSQPTVSRVLNESNTTIAISDETREKVMAAVAELDYRPNMHARSLRTQRTNMIAVLIADIFNSFYPLITGAIQEVARKEGYDVMIANSNHNYENELNFCEAITRRPVDGVIMVPIHLSMQDLDDFYMRTDTPITVLGQHVNHPNIDVVYVQDDQAIYEATLWLIEEKGHTQLGFVGVPDNLPPGPRRRRGFLRAIQETQLEVEPQHILEGDFTLEGGKRIAQELLKLDSLPSALLVANDLMAIGIILILQDAGLSVPDDIAIVGYDDIPESRIIRPVLTTIAHDPADIGYKLIRSLFERIENPNLPNRRLESTYKLLKRDST